MDEQRPHFSSNFTLTFTIIRKPVTCLTPGVQRHFLEKSHCADALYLLTRSVCSAALGLWRMLPLERQGGAGRQAEREQAG